eukprot:4437270-Pyramimonas_sp.AAC.1
MYAVNTLVPHSPAYTYTANNGQRHRTDYIMATQQGMQAVKEVEVWTEFDNAMAQPDHQPVSVCFQWVTLTHPPRSGPKGISMTAMKDPGACSQFQEKVRQIPAIPWTTD